MDRFFAKRGQEKQLLKLLLQVIIMIANESREGTRTKDIENPSWFCSEDLISITSSRKSAIY